MSNETPKKNEIPVGFTQVNPPPTNIGNVVANRATAERSAKVVSDYAKATLAAYRKEKL